MPHRIFQFFFARMRLSEMVRALLVPLALCLAAAAQPAIAGQPLLTVNATAVGGTKMTFDLAALDALPQQSFRTATPWTVGVKRFSGPSLQAVLNKAGAHNGKVLAIALNNYSVTMPMKDLGPEAPVIVTRIDKKTYGIRDKGPLWVLYPFDRAAKYRTEVNDSRSIWQLTKLTVTPK